MAVLHGQNNTLSIVDRASDPIMVLTFRIFGQNLGIRIPQYMKMYLEEDTLFVNDPNTGALAVVDIEK